VLEVALATEEQTRSLSELEAARPFVEARIGRELRAAERAIDIFRLDAALNTAKDELERAINAEKDRAIRRFVLRGRPLSLEVTRAMLEPLERLYRLGRSEAAAELARHGFETVRAYAADPKHERLLPIAYSLERGLYRLRRRIERERTVASVGAASQAAIARALYRVAGARNVAAGLVSGALTNGLGATFEANSSLAGGFEYTAVLDGGTCEECEALDGEQYESWEAIQEVLPDGGQNPECYGGSRCRCRAVPLPRDTRP
jgi:hypothetical protein